MANPLWALPLRVVPGAVPDMILTMLVGGIVAFALLWVHHCRWGWYPASKSGARLPKGSFGWPLIGESIPYIQDPAAFRFSRVKRYGRIFKSSLFLRPMVVGTTPEFAKFVTSNSHVFLTGWPKSFSDILGTKAFIHLDGPLHVALKKVVSRFVQNTETLRGQANIIETIILEHLASWERRGSVVAYDITRELTWDITNWLFLGVRDTRSTPEGKKCFANFKLFNKALGSIPVKLPGSNYSKGMKARKELRAYFYDLVEKRKSQEGFQKDIVGVLLEAQHDPEARQELKDLDTDGIIDTLVMVFFAAYDTTSVTVTWSLKFLANNPDVFRRMQAEHKQIYESKKQSVEGPTGTRSEDIRKMVYTQKFFQEVQRILSIVPASMRKAAQDIEFEGTLIPKGWGVAVVFNGIHLDPSIYPDPLSFNPDRFPDILKPNTYLPAGVGTHLCPGMELAKLVSFITLHHLITTYSYESAGPDMGMQYIGFPTINGGYPINIWRQKEADVHKFDNDHACSS